MENTKLRNGILLSLGVIAILVISSLAGGAIAVVNIDNNPAVVHITQQLPIANYTIENWLPNQGLALTTLPVVTTSYSNVMQYTWPCGGYNESRTMASTGPAPDYPNVIWSSNAFVNSGSVTAFEGYCFAVGSSTVTEFDPMTGAVLWIDTLNGTSRGPVQGATQTSATTFFVETENGAEGFNLQGQSLWNLTITETNWGTLRQDRPPGAGRYWDDAYDPDNGIHCYCDYNTTARVNSMEGWNFSNPDAVPTLAWEYINDESGEILCYGGGLFYSGNYAFSCFAMNATTGDLVWETQRPDELGYGGTYVDNGQGGELITGGSSTHLIAYNATDGAVLWDNSQGGRAFMSYFGGAAYGNFYVFNIAVPDGWFGCYSLATGALLWKQPGWAELAYWIPCIGDGKVYCTTSDGSTTSSRPGERLAFSCMDAYTGTTLWQIATSGVSYPSIAYGNLYISYGSRTYCISTYNTPTAWNGFNGNQNSPGSGNINLLGSSADIAVNPQSSYAQPAVESSPLVLQPEWQYQTGGACGFGSPAVANGIVYEGSDDYHLYALNAITGAQIWNFSVGHQVWSTPCVSGGVVYTGADDGYVYALNATTGALIWEYNIYAGAVPLYQFQATWQPRSSPLVANGMVYVGALNGWMYALNAQTGGLVWSYATYDPLAFWDNNASAIGGSPSYDQGMIFFQSINRNTYALNATNGALIWNYTEPELPSSTLNANIIYLFGTCTEGGGLVYCGGGVQYFTINLNALNETTGALVWNVALGGNSQPVNTPVYFGNVSYTAYTINTHTLAETSSTATVPVLFMAAAMAINAYNATNGARLWNQFMGHQVYATASFCNGLRGPVLYLGSDSYGETCYNCTMTTEGPTGNSTNTYTGATVGVQQTGGNGTAISTYTTQGEVDDSAAIYGNNVYIGSADGNVYCLGEEQSVMTSISVASDKGSTMWNNETMDLSGRLIALSNATYPDGVYAPYTPGIPGATVFLTFTYPDLSQVKISATTDANGYFTATFSPTVTGTYSWLAWYQGQNNLYDQYEYTYGTFNTLTVTAAPSGSSVSTPPPSTTAPTSSPTSSSLPVVYIYAIIAIIIIIIVAIAAYALTRRSKTPKQ